MEEEEEVEGRKKKKTENENSFSVVVKSTPKPNKNSTLTERLVDVDGCGVGERPDLRVCHAGFEERRDGEAGPDVEEWN